MTHPSHGHEPQTAYRTVAVLGLLLLGVLLLPTTRLTPGLAHYLPLHIALETVAVAIAGLVFAVGWSTQSHQPSAGVLWTACLFLGVGVLDLSHLLSFTGMPAFVTPSGPEKAINFWFSARTLAALALLGAALWPWQTAPRGPRAAWLLGALALVALAHGVFLFRPEVVPHTFLAGQGLTPFKVRYEYGLMLAYLAAAALFWRQLHQPRRQHASGLLAASVTMAMSEWCFTLYSDTGDLYNLVGHLYKIAAYAFLYNALFVETVHRPYLQLGASKQRLRATLDALPDLLFEMDLDGQYLGTPAQQNGLLLAEKDQLVGRNVRDVMPPAAAQICLQALQRAHTHGVAHGARLALDVPDGRRHFELSIARSEPEPGQPARFLMLSRDVTDIVAHEAAVLREARLNSALLGLAPAARQHGDAGALRHALTQARQLTGSAVAVAYSATGGTDGGTWIGAAEAHDDALAELWRSPTPTAPWSSALNGPAAVRVEADDAHPPLQRWLAVPVVENGQVVAVMGLGNKPTPYDDPDQDTLQTLAQNLWALLNRRQQDRRLRAQQTELDHFFNANLDLLCSIDTHGTLMRVNGAWEPITGQTAQHLQGQHLLDFVHPDDRHTTLAALARLNTQPGALDFENRWIGHDGQVHHLEWRAQAGGAWFYASARDVTERKAQNATIEKLSAAVAQSPFPVVITDLNANIEYVNAACCDTTGYRAEELIGHNPRLLQSGKTPAATYRDLWARLTAGQAWHGELTNRRKNGTEYVEKQLIYPVRNSAGQVVNYLAHKEDVTDKIASAERIRQLLQFDQLTGLPNRAQLLERCAVALDKARQRGHTLALMAIDLDHFKAVNNALGPASGDLLLRELAQRLQAQLSEQDTVSRQSGDDFLVLLPETGADQAAALATKLLQALQQPFTLARQELSVGASIGVALYPNDGDTLESLQMAAESAMYRVKQEGRNAFRFFAPDMQRHTARTLAVGNALKQALSRGELRLVYQPQRALGSERVVGAEALLRWDSPQWGAVSPAEFVPMAEADGLIVPIGDWVLRTATQQLRRWHDAGWHDLTLAVNLSAIQFAQPELVGQVTQIAAEAGIPPNRLELELTEAVALKHPEAARLTMAALSDAGFRLSIDDFGTGYSSMSYLKRFAVDKLKIDQSFVRELTADRDDQAIVTAIIQMAHSLGMTTIAEGVETASQMEFLRRRGCDEMQGYLFSRPLTPADFEAFLAAQSHDQ